MDKQTVLKVAKLARLKIDDERAEVLAADLGGIFKWIEQLNEVDTNGVEPMTSVGGQKAFRRPDVVTDGNKQAEIMRNAPDSAEGFFVVPKVVE
ncbi:MAG: gatC [Alphaproteobacteria bacterium]|nr:gatC [Alphaproteobacteria bacterium]